jgi:hypothetical protein
MPSSDNLFLGRYQLLKQVGRGGMAAVFLATDIQTRRQVAVKVLSTLPVTTDQYKVRFRQEAKALAQLSHPNIVRVLDYGEIGGRPYLVLEWVGGGTLSTRMGKPIPYQEAAKLILPIARALQYAHELGIIHRDVKPSNILLSESGEPLLSDFGIAKSLSQEPAPDLTGPGGGIGTPEYMAPEQGMGQPVDQRADVYSLGVILYELLTGRKPYTADTPLGTMMQATTQPLPRAREIVPDLPEEVERVLFKVLAKEPAKRYPSMGEFAEVLEKLILGEKLTSKEAPPIPKNGGRASTASLAEPKAEKPPKSPREPRELKLPSWAIPAGIGLGVLVIAILAVVLVAKLRSGAPPKQTQLATVADIQGDVQIVDGGSQAVAAKTGALMARSTHTVLKTNTGRVRFSMVDGTFVVMDSQAAIEFGLPGGTPPSSPVMFNLVGGKTLVMTKQDNQTPFNVLMGSRVTVSGTGAVMGLQVQDQNGGLQDVDCLVGSCQVSAAGQFLGLSAGQHVQLGADGVPSPADGARYDEWSGLGGADVPQPSLTPTATLAPVLPTVTEAPTNTPAPSNTPVVLPSLPPTETPTLVSTATLTKRPRPTSTRTPTNVPNDNHPNPTAVPPTRVPPTSVPPTLAPPTNVPPTVAPTAVIPTEPPPPTSTHIPPTEPPPPEPTQPPPPTDPPPPADTAVP